MITDRSITNENPSPSALSKKNHSLILYEKVTEICQKAGTAIDQYNDELANQYYLQALSTLSDHIKMNLTNGELTCVLLMQTYILCLLFIFHIDLEIERTTDAFAWDFRTANEYFNEAQKNFEHPLIANDTLYHPLAERYRSLIMNKIGLCLTIIMDDLLNEFDTLSLRNDISKRESESIFKLFKKIPEISNARDSSPSGSPPSMKKY